jgi:hypothetical protein
MCFLAFLLPTADTMQKYPVPEPESLFPELDSFDSFDEALTEILEKILPSYYEVDDSFNKKNREEMYSRGLHGVIFGLSSSKKLRTYSQVADPVPVFGKNDPPVAASPAAAPPPNPKKPAPKENPIPAQSDSHMGVSSVISSAVWVPTPGGGNGTAENFQTEAMLRRSLAEDTEIPLSFLKTLLFSS